MKGFYETYNKNEKLALMVREKAKECIDP